MDFINYHRLVEEENGNYTLVIYLNEHEAEFARELSQVDNDTKKRIYIIQLKKLLINDFQS